MFQFRCYLYPENNENNDSHNMILYTTLYLNYSLLFISTTLYLDYTLSRLPSTSTTLYLDCPLSRTYIATLWVKNFSKDLI